MEYDPEIVVVKRGRNSGLCDNEKCEEYELLAFSVSEAVDVTSTSDAFTSDLLLGLSRGDAILLVSNILVTVCSPSFM